VDHPALGTLDWQPATGRCELLAAPVAAAVRALDLACFVAPIDPDLADTAAFCGAYHVGLDVSANCVVVAGRRGETTTTAACLVLATDRADVNKVVRKRLDVRKISFASMDDAVQQTRMEYGGITPIGLPPGWPVLVDEAVARATWVVVGSGLRGSKIAVPGAALSTLPGAEILALAVSAAG
jgi:prolyl-tRNA editing enzyme YbaK/EbsC (Cys-tRNA(Pro) deacylase)